MLMTGSERHWDAFVGWPIVRTCVRGLVLGGTDQLFEFPEAQNLTLWAFFVGYVNNIVYGEKIRDFRHLQDRIRAAIATATPDMIQWNWQEIKQNLSISQATNIAHNETYWGETKTS
jgi:hypothetical protein